eukprot:UN13805
MYFWFVKFSINNRGYVRNGISIQENNFTQSSSCPSITASRSNESISTLLSVFSLFIQSFIT